MAGPRYDLTTKVTPFLDPLLVRKIDEFNGTPVSALGPAPQGNPTPSLESAQQLYESGNFAAASKMLSELKFDPNSDEFEALVWGKLASDLLSAPEATNTSGPKPSEIKPVEATDVESVTGEDETAAPTEDEVDPVIKDLLSVQDLLDQRRTGDSTVQLNRRAWLIHWALFAYFNGRLPKLVDTFFMSQYMSVIQAACPWVLRYVVVAVVATHPRTARFNRRVKDATRVVQQELYEYTDPVVDFIRALYIDFDFTNIAAKLDAAFAVLRDDYFAHDVAEQFIDNARVLVANSLLRVHDCLSVSDFCQTLGLKEGEESKKWISDYIVNKQEAKLDAVFDEAKSIVRVTYTKPSVNSQILEKVKMMDQRAYQLQQSQSKKSEA